jgi:hypothetical protein
MPWKRKFALAFSIACFVPEADLRALFPLLTVVAFDATRFLATESSVFRL